MLPKVNKSELTHLPFSLSLSLDSGLHTVSKARCAREECNEPALKLSKYCSDLCGIKVAAAKLEESTLNHHKNNNNDSTGEEMIKPENLKLLWDAVSEVKKLETVVRDTESGNVATGQDQMEVDITNTELGDGGAAAAGGIPKGVDLEARIAEEEYRLDQLQSNLSDYVTKRQNLELSLSLINARLSYLQLAIRRWEVTCQLHMANNIKPSTSSKKSSKSKSGGGSNAVNADAPCGFDVRLVWDDKDWQEWLDSEEGRNIMLIAEEGGDATVLPPIPTAQGKDDEEVEEGDNDEEGLVCKLSRRKCDRHSAWQKLRDADFQGKRLPLCILSASFPY